MKATAGSTSRSGTASAACSRTTAARSRSGVGTAGRCSATSPSSRPLGELLPPHSALDGEIVIARDGASSSTCSRCGSTRPRAGSNARCGDAPRTFIAFDLLLWDGEEVHERPPRGAARRARVTPTIPALPHDAATRSEARGLDRPARPAGLDGVICKRLGLPYLPGSRDGVLKVKRHRTADCVVVGLRWKAKPTAASCWRRSCSGSTGTRASLDYVGTAAVAPSRKPDIADRVLPLSTRSPTGGSRSRTAGAPAISRRPRSGPSLRRRGAV